MAALHVHSIGAGPDLALIHGFGGTHEAWGTLQDRLADKVRTHAVDLPGHGASMDYPGAGPTKTAVAAVLATMDALGVQRFHIAGHSLGGAVAALVALAAPDRVLSLTLLAPGGFGPEINIRLLKRYAAAQKGPEIEAALEGMTGFLNPVSPLVVDRCVRMRATPGQTEILVRFAEGMTRDGRQGVIPRAQLATLPMPVRLLWGLQDNVLPAHSADGLPDRWTVEGLAETGHMLIEEAPDAVAAALECQIAAASAAP